MTRQEIAALVDRALSAVLVLDMHTHLFPPAFGKLPLWGIDELLTYHYLEAELFRSASITPDNYWKLDKRSQADLIWRTLFVENAPISDATRGVVYVLHRFGLPVDAPDLKQARDFFQSQQLSAHMANVFAMAGVSDAVMTNDPLDPEESKYWMSAVERPASLHAALRLDRILNRWDEHVDTLRAQGYDVDLRGRGASMSEVQRFLASWVERMRPKYMAVSLPYTFRYPAGDLRYHLIRDAVLPACREAGIPMALMIGPAYQVNPAIRLAGDSVGKSDIRSVETLCRNHPDNRFFITMLSRENQHELCVAARKFGNLMPFGCWWFLNNTSIVDEITRERIEMLGSSVIPQHSDARVLEHLIYKWRNARRVIAQVLTDSYVLMAEDGRTPRESEIERDVYRMMRGNFERWTQMEPHSGQAKAGARE